MKEYRLNYWRGQMQVERIYVDAARNRDRIGYFERDSADATGHRRVFWSGDYPGRCPKVLDSVLGDQRLGRHATWRDASEEGDHDPIWWALLFAAGVR